jgi:hypothetical protein
MSDESEAPPSSIVWSCICMITYILLYAQDVKRRARQRPMYAGGTTPSVAVGERDAER